MYNMQLRIAETSGGRLLFIQVHQVRYLHGKNCPCALILYIFARPHANSCWLICNNLLLVCTCKNRVGDTSNEKGLKGCTTNRNKVRYNREKARSPNNSQEREGLSMAGYTTIKVIQVSIQPHKPDIYLDSSLMVHMCRFKLIQANSYYIFKCAWRPGLCVLIIKLHIYVVSLHGILPLLSQCCVK